MFESLKSAVQDLLNGRVAPGDRRAAIADMKHALVLAKLGVADLNDGVEVTRQRVVQERSQLETAQRRKVLAEGIHDAETVALAEKFIAQYSERLAVLERKLEAQEAEAALAERDYDEMLKQLKSADRGAGSGITGDSRGPTDSELGLPDDAPLRSELDALARKGRRSDADAAAEAKLAELKKRMGQ